MEPSKLGRQRINLFRLKLPFHFAFPTTLSGPESKTSSRIPTAVAVCRLMLRPSTILDASWGFPRKTASEELQEGGSGRDHFGWGGRIRTSECRCQRPVSYRLTTPQFRGEASKKCFRNSTRFNVQLSISRISPASIIERAWKSSFWNQKPRTGQNRSPTILRPLLLTLPVTA